MLTQEKAFMHKIFISYSRKDYSSVVKLKDEIDLLLGKGVCWMDLTGIESDSQFVEVIINAINKSDIFLFMHSKSSEQSDWTRKEVMYANGKGKRLVFVKIDSTPLSDYFAFQFAGHDIIDLNDKKQKQKLLKDLVNWCGAKSQSNSRVKSRTTSYSKNKKGGVTERIRLFLCAFLKDLKDLGNNELFNNIRDFVSQKSFIKAFIWLIITMVFVSSGSYVLMLSALIGGYFSYRDTIHEKNPKFEDYLQLARHNSLRILMVLNIILSVFFLSIACTGYDSDFHFALWGMLMFSITLVIFVFFKLINLNNMSKTERSIYLVFPICLYLVAVIVFQVQKYKIESYSKKIDHVEKKIESLQVDTAKIQQADAKSVLEKIETYDLEIPDTVYPMNYCDGVLDNSNSRLWISSISVEGEIDTIFAYILSDNEAFGRGLGFALIRNKRILEGIVETHDNTQYKSTTGCFIKEYLGEKKIGYVEGLFDIIDNKIKIKGVIQTDSLINGKYEHDFSCEGYISNRLFK